MEPLHRLLGWVQPAPRGWIWGVPGAAGTTARLRPSPGPCRRALRVDGPGHCPMGTPVRTHCFGCSPLAPAPPRPSQGTRAAPRPLARPLRPGRRAGRPAGPSLPTFPEQLPPRPPQPAHAHSPAPSGQPRAPHPEEGTPCPATSTVARMSVIDTVRTGGWPGAPRRRDALQRWGGGGGAARSAETRARAWGPEAARSPRPRRAGGAPLLPAAPAARPSPLGRGRAEPTPPERAEV